MRRLLLQMQMSVDGFVSSDDPALEWTLWDWGPQCPWDADLKRKFNAILEGVDTVLLSGPMAEDYINHWTRISELCAHDPDYRFASRVVAWHKRVVSRSITSLSTPRTRLVSGPLSNEVAQLKKEPGRNIICFGGVRFAAALLETGAVDELQLFVNPSVVASGDSIFGKARRLRLIDAVPYECGIVVQRYRP